MMMHKLNIALYSMIVISSIFGIYFHHREIAALMPKVEKFDEVCGYVKSALHTDKLRLANPDDRKAMLADFAGNHIGDGMQMLDWCVPHAKESVIEVRRCASLGDFVCIDRMLQAMGASISSQAEK